MKKCIMTMVMSVGMMWSGASQAQLIAESDTSPQRLVPSRGKIYYNYNIQETQRDADRDGTPETVYRYNYVIIDPPATKGKILEALRKAKNADQSFDPADVEAEQSAVEVKLADIAAMSYAEIDTHINNTFGNLNETQKASLKKLYKAVLALIKQLDLE